MIFAKKKIIFITVNEIFEIFQDHLQSFLDIFSNRGIGYLQKMGLTLKLP